MANIQISAPAQRRVRRAVASLLNRVMLGWPMTAYQEVQERDYHAEP